MNRSICIILSVSDQVLQLVTVAQEAEQPLHLTVIDRPVHAVLLRHTFANLVLQLIFG
jgi:hypothetical protein